MPSHHSYNFTGKDPKDTAAELLEMLHGDRHEAETRAWKIWAHIAGGTPGRRIDPDCFECRHLMSVVKILDDGRCEPSYLGNAGEQFTRQTRSEIVRKAMTEQLPNDDRSLAGV